MVKLPMLRTNKDTDFQVIIVRDNGGGLDHIALRLDLQKNAGLIDLSRAERKGAEDTKSIVSLQPGAARRQVDAVLIAIASLEMMFRKSVPLIDCQLERNTGQAANNFAGGTFRQGQIHNNMTKNNTPGRML